MAALGLTSARWDAAYVGLLAWTAVVSTGFGFLLWIEILRHLAAGTASLNIFAIPVIALVSSMLVFGERLTRSEWAGIGCIGAGLAILSWQTLASARRAKRNRPRLHPRRSMAADGAATAALQRPRARMQAGRTTGGRMARGDSSS